MNRLFLKLGWRTLLRDLRAATLEERHADLLDKFIGVELRVGPVLDLADPQQCRLVSAPEAP